MAIYQEMKMLSLVIVTSALMMFASVGIADGQTQNDQFRCRTAKGREPNISDTSCESYLTCSNYTGQVQLCAGGQQFHYRDLVCKTDAEVWCNEQRRNYARFLSRLNSTTARETTTPLPESTSTVNETESTTQAPTTTSAPVPSTTAANNQNDIPVTNDSGIGALLGILFPQLANIPGIETIIPGLGALQGNAAGGIVGLNADGVNLAPNVGQITGAVGPVEGFQDPPLVAPDAFDGSRPIVISAVVTGPDAAILSGEDAAYPLSSNSVGDKSHADREAGIPSGHATIISDGSLQIPSQRNNVQSFVGFPGTTLPVLVTSQNKGPSPDITYNQNQAFFVPAGALNPGFTQAGTAAGIIRKQDAKAAGIRSVNSNIVDTVPLTVTTPIFPQRDLNFGFSGTFRTLSAGVEPPQRVNDTTAPAAFFPARSLGGL